MEKICQTCGSNDWKELLVTCTKCCIVREHSYCMQEHGFEAPRHWICSGCSMKPVQKNAAPDPNTAGPSNQRNNERPIKARNESSKPVPKWKPIPETARVKVIPPEEAIRLSSGTTRLSSSNMVPRPNPSGSAMRFNRQIVSGLRSEGLKSAMVSRKTSPSFLQFKTFDPPRRSASQIGPNIEKQTTKPPEVLEGLEPNVGAEAISHDIEERCSWSLSDKLVQFLSYLPALHSTWKGNFRNFATAEEFYGEYSSQPASKIRQKAYNLSKVMPVLLNVELLTVGSYLNDLFKNKKPNLCDVELYFFPDEKNTDRIKGKHTHLLEIILNGDVMIRSNIKGTDLLIFSSRLLDEASQSIINKQKKTSDFLWGVFLRAKSPQPPRLLLLRPLRTSFHNNPTKSPDQNREFSIPPGFQTIQTTPNSKATSPTAAKSGNIAGEPRGTPGLSWMPPPSKWVKLNVQRTLKPESDLTGSAGIARDESGRWVCGYVVNLKNLSELSADLWAVYQGLKLLWDRGFRKVIVETTSLNALEALNANSLPFQQSNSILQRCKDMLLKNWECRICAISEEQNSCAVWLANKAEEQPTGLVVFDSPPGRLITLLGKDCTAAVTES
ncbi:PREDICTED: uncharacterized protein LOC104801226 isoform X2 [Tarenaya hassleriana]|uniref:uncharacterized protein LOC104801226 isoform X2 n=1 Tax=Tarenaya hassleriana TaxID=28532 RepID=UPI00053C79BB|nr:PREDICTED: uncharacterized protein LOC104801226 isoform X2 [Tarenaya hassleriana]